MDLDLNCSPPSPDEEPPPLGSSPGCSSWPGAAAIWEELKQAMLGHEIIFRNQVREMHRLYCTQKSLMDQIDPEEDNGEGRRQQNGWALDLNKVGGNGTFLWPIDLEQPEITLDAVEDEFGSPFFGRLPKKSGNFFINAGSTESNCGMNNSSSGNSVMPRQCIDLNVTQVEEQYGSPNHLQMPDFPVSRTENFWSDLKRTWSKQSDSPNGSSKGSNITLPLGLNKPGNVYGASHEVQRFTMVSVEIKGINLNETIGSEEDTVSSHAVAELSSHKDCPVNDFCSVASMNFSDNHPPDASLDYAATSAADDLVATAAETLISISSGATTSCAESSSPEYSLDSFAQAALRLEEVEDDGMSAPSRLSTKMDGQSASCGINLRRGRGLRNFQRDVLPGLASLAKHEISDDLIAIGYKLRHSRFPRRCAVRQKR